jgi:hypothetical protein
VLRFYGAFNCFNAIFDYPLGIKEMLKQQNGTDWNVSIPVEENGSCTSINIGEYSLSNQRLDIEKYGYHSIGCYQDMNGIAQVIRVISEQGEKFNFSNSLSEWRLL